MAQIGGRYRLVTTGKIAMLRRNSGSRRNRSASISENTPVTVLGD